MFEGLIGTIAIVVLIIVAVRQNKRIGLLEREIGALRSFVLAKPTADESSKPAAPAEESAATSDQASGEAAAATTDSRTVRTSRGARTLGGRRVGIRKTGGDG